MKLLVNIDVADLSAAEAFHTAAFGLTSGRHLGRDDVELLGADAAIYLSQQPTSSVGANTSPRDHARHWTPIHCDLVADNIDEAIARTLANGATQEGVRRQQALNQAMRK